MEQLRLNDKFNLDVLMDFTWVPEGAPGGGGGGPVINVDWSLVVKIDIPPPFSFIPGPVLEATGDTAFGAIMPVIIVSAVRVSLIGRGAPVGLLGVASGAV